MEQPEACTHITSLTELKVADELVCEICIKNHSTWVHLRTCQDCGVTLCCNDSPNRHASKHAKAMRHPVIASAEPGERWLYCYVHKTSAEY